MVCYCLEIVLISSFNGLLSLSFVRSSKSTTRTHTIHLNPPKFSRSVPGLREFVSNTPELLESNKEVPEWLTGLDQEDVDLLWSLGRLTSAQILEKVKELYNLAFELDIEEDKEMTRGKFLEVLERKSCDQSE